MKNESHPRVSVGLVHWPVLDKRGRVVATNVTNLDVHDIARASRVFGIERYFIINPMKEQLMFVHRLLEFWRKGTGATYNPMRRTALTGVETAETVEKVVTAIGGEVIVVGTSARDLDSEERAVGFKGLREEIWESGSEKRWLILFGTGYGMTEEVLAQCRYILEPIRGAAPEDYRHLSVRSAASICLDRLLGAC